MESVLVRFLGNVWRAVSQKDSGGRDPNVGAEIAGAGFMHCFHGAFRGLYVASSAIEQARMKEHGVERRVLAILTFSISRMVFETQRFMLTGAFPQSLAAKPGTGVVASTRQSYC